MRTMMLSDFIIMRSALAQTAGILLVVAAFITFATDTPVTGAAALGAMAPFMYLFNVCALDEMNDWQRFRLTLPLTRHQVVGGRYLSILAVAVIAALAAVIFGCIAAAIQQGLAENPAVPGTDGGESAQAYGLAAVAEMVIILLAASVTLPLVFRFGMTKTTRLVPLAIVLVMAAIIAFSANGMGNVTVNETIAFLGNTGGVALLCAAALAAALAVYALSAVIAAKLYSSRQL